MEQAGKALSANAWRAIHGLSEKHFKMFARRYLHGAIAAPFTRCSSCLLHALQYLIPSPTAVASCSLL